MPQYTFKPTAETVWLILTALVGAVATGFATQGATPPTDWHAWAVGLSAAAVRAVLGVILSMMTGPKAA